MRRVPPERWPIVLAAHAAAGVLTAVSTSAIATLATRAGLRPSFSMVLVVNAAWPLTVIALAFWYPRLRTVWAGSAALVAAFIASNMLAAEPRPWLWTPQLLAAKSHPIMVIAALGCAVLGSIAAFSVRACRRVEHPPEGPRCPACKYSLTGLTGPRCPECGSDLVSIA